MHLSISLISFSVITIYHWTHSNSCPRFANVRICSHDFVLTSHIPSTAPNGLSRYYISDKSKTKGGRQRRSLTQQRESGSKISTIFLDASPSPGFLIFTSSLLSISITTNQASRLLASSSFLTPANPHLQPNLPP